MPFALGVVVRVTTPNFLAADLSFESSVLTGVIGGPLAGALCGILVSLPSAVHGEWLNLPFCIFAGIVAGAVRELAKDREDIWSFSPFIDLSIYRWIRRNLPRPKHGLADRLLLPHPGAALPAGSSSTAGSRKLHLQRGQRQLLDSGRRSSPPR